MLDDLFSTIARDDKILIAAQIIQRRSSMADFLCVGGYKIEVNMRSISSMVEFGTGVSSKKRAPLEYKS